MTDRRMSLADLSAEINTVIMPDLGVLGKLLLTQLRAYGAGEGPPPTVIDDIPRAIAAVNQIVQEMVAAHGRVLQKVTVS